MKIYNIFESFFIRKNLSLNTDELIESCLLNKQQSLSDGRYLSNNGGWQSKNIDLNSPNINLIVSELKSNFPQIKEMFGLKKHVSLFVGNGWINVNSKNDFNVPHVHPNSLVSAVYYVKVPNNSGKLVFDNPISQHNFIISSDAIQNFNTLNSSIWSIQPNEGELVMFPSWLKHWVEPNRSGDERISLAFNIQIDWAKL